MKKGTIYEGIVRCVKFPNKGVVSVENGEQEVSVKYAIPGQKVKILVNKVRKGKAEGRILEVLEASPEEMKSPCPHFGMCGGCAESSIRKTVGIKGKSGPGSVKRPDSGRDL